MLKVDGKTLHLIYDPGNSQRAQALPNYDVMIPLPSSTTQEVVLPGVGKKWVAIVDAKSPAQPMLGRGCSVRLEDIELLTTRLLAILQASERQSSGAAPQA